MCCCPRRAKVIASSLMPLRFLLLIILAVQVPCFAARAGTKPPRAVSVAAARIAGKVVGVHDGDSLTLYRGTGPQLKIRLDGIDAPELKQAFGAAAKRRLSDLVFGNPVLIEVEGKDPYGRTLGVVQSDGQNVNLEMVRSGFAWHFVRYSKDKRLAAAEVSARGARTGLLAESAPVTPWVFRSGQR